MKEQPKFAYAYFLHTISATDSRNRTFVGEIENTTTDFEDIKLLLESMEKPIYDFVSSCEEKNSIRLRIIDENNVFRFSLSSDITPQDIQNFLKDNNCTFKEGSGINVLDENFNESFRMKLYRLIVPVHNCYIKIRFNSILKEKQNEQT